jgi:phosphoribosyl 1,2-cyclic phosphate phosphodiesterase
MLFDAPPNCGLAAMEQGVTLADVKYLFVTHSHQDHFDPCVLAARGRQQARPLDLCCNRHLASLLPIYEQFNRFFKPEALGLRIHPLEPGMVWHPPDRSFAVKALLANHDRTGGECPLIYILETPQHCLLYACDTGWIPEESWRHLAQHHYDAVVLDCTFHLQRACRDGHLGIDAFLEQKQRFEADGLLNSSSVFIAQHIHRGHDQTHIAEKEIAERLRQNGVLPAADGMRVAL